MCIQEFFLSKIFFGQSNPPSNSYLYLFPTVLVINKNLFILNKFSLERLNKKGFF